MIQNKKRALYLVFFFFFQKLELELFYVDLWCGIFQQIDALDHFEDLTEIGYHLADLPLEPRLGKVVLYSIVLKCLDPVLTIVCALAYKDPCKILLLLSWSLKSNAQVRYMTTDDIVMTIIHKFTSLCNWEFYKDK